MINFVTGLLIGFTAVLLFCHEQFLAGACMFIAYNVFRVADALEKRDC